MYRSDIVVALLAVAAWVVLMFVFGGFPLPL